MEALAGFLAEQVLPHRHPRGSGGPGRSFEIAGPWIPAFAGMTKGNCGQLAQRAAHLAKADLSTAMVGEFPELQGVMGRYYAVHDR